MSNDLEKQTLYLKERALDARARASFEVVPPESTAVAECAVSLVHCSNNRLLNLFDGTAHACEQQNYDCATLSARALLSTIGYCLYLYRRLSDEPEKANEIVWQFYTSNDMKRKLFKNSSLKKKIFLTEQAKSNFERVRFARISAGDAIKKGLAFVIGSAKPEAVEHCLELYDRLSEASHDSQVSIVYMHSTLGNATPTSIAHIDFIDALQHDIWQALAHLQLFDTFKADIVSHFWSLEGRWPPAGAS